MSPAHVVPDHSQLSTRQAMQLLGAGLTVATFFALIASGQQFPAALLALAILGPAFVASVRALRRQLAAEAPTPLPDWTDEQLDVLHGRLPTPYPRTGLNRAAVRWPLPPEDEAVGQAVAVRIDAAVGTHFAALRAAIPAQAHAELNRIGALLRRSPRGVA